MKIGDLYGEPDKYGVFYWMFFTVPNENRPPWAETEYLSVLSVYYYWGYSKDKNISILAQSLYNQVNTPGDFDRSMGRLLRFLYAESWTRIWESLFSDYNPIENYNMVENENSDVTNSARSQAKTKVTNTSNDKGYGFNSTMGSNTATSESTSVSNLDDNMSQSNASSTGDRKLTRNGNIGVTTTQQMITQELELRKTQFFEIVCNDVDKILASPLY